jgi:hypothetical protein
MSELLKDDYLKKAYPTNETPEKVKSEVDDYREDIEQYLQVFKEYFNSRATAMGLDAEHRKVRQEKFLKELISYAIDSALPLMKAQQMEDKSMSSEIEKQAMANTEKNAETLLANILADLGLESTSELKNASPVETQGTKTENVAVYKIQNSLPDEISDTFLKMRKDLVEGTPILSYDFPNMYRELYESLI